MAAGEDTVKTPTSIGAGSNVERQSEISSVSVLNTTVSRSDCICTADMDSISQKVPALQHTLTAETLAYRENQIFFQTATHTLKKELSDLLEEEISKVTKAHQQELEAQEKKHIAWKALLDEHYQIQEACAADMDSISRTVQALQHTLTAETLANRENKILFQTTAHTLKKELSELLEGGISKATKAHQQELEAQEKKHTAWKELLEERYQKQEALVASLQAEVKQLKLRTGLLDCASPAFVSVSGVSSITAKSPPRKSHPFYSHPCGYKMTLSLGRDPQGGLFILLNIAGGDYEKLLQWPFLGKIIVEIVGFSALDQTQTVRGLIGVLETDGKSGIRGGGGYVGQVVSRLLQSHSDVLQLLEKQTRGAKEALADPYYYLEEDTLHFRITTALRTSSRS